MIRYLGPPDDPPDEPPPPLNAAVDASDPITSTPATAPMIPHTFPAFRLGGMGGGIPGPPPYPKGGACWGIP
ncbi:hypothetical protein IPZ61_17640 [Streptomyces sioyaensis]|uniref:hypothetical protein n=1 Tax=Streptomyces sioyaensis TaxID=67364 RepID=UPI001F1B0470|nr:hypothetical protein [Streptomyces sioyaensis]MCF3175133.1 hypothetical protein [Streptomyces sioyaensis]